MTAQKGIQNHLDIANSFLIMKEIDADFHPAGTVFGGDIHSNHTFDKMWRGKRMGNKPREPNEHFKNNND